jgi:hypothetical protein
MHRVAAATIRSFLHRIADAITEPVPDRSDDRDAAEVVTVLSWSREQDGSGRRPSDAVRRGHRGRTNAL